MIDDIQQNIFYFFEEKNVLLIIWYGRRGGRDVDLLVLLKDDLDYNNFQFNHFDVSYLGWSLAWEMISKLDPLITEPILEGVDVFGSSRKLLSFIKNIKPDCEVCEYLNSRSLVFLDWSETYFSLGNFKEILNCLRFSLGFFYFLKFYQKNSRVITLKELKLELDCSFMIEIEDYMKNNSRSNLFTIFNFRRKADELLTYSF